MKKKAIAALLSICMVFTLLPLSLPVSAANIPVSIAVKGENGETIDLLKAPSESYPKGLSYDRNTNTLTLDNFSTTSYVSSFTAAGIEVFGTSNLTICLKGQNVIRIDSNSVYGIGFVHGSKSQNTAITGDGSLIVDGPWCGLIGGDGKLTIDSSVSLLAGFGMKSSLFNFDEVIIGGEAYTGNATEGAVVNGKVIDKVRKTPLDLTAESVSYGTEGAFNPKTQSVTVEATGEGWGWNHETSTLTMSGTTIYSSTGDYALRLPRESTQIELTTDTENAVIGPDGYDVCAIKGTAETEFSINGGGSLTALGGKSTVESSGASRAINSDYLAISGSVRVTAIGGTANNLSGGLGIYRKLEIFGAAHVRAVTGRGGTCSAISQSFGEGVFISENAYVETDASSVAANGTGIDVTSGNLEISGGTVKMLNSRTRGINVKNVYDEEKGHIRITGGTVEVAGTSSSFSSIVAENDITVTGGSVTVTEGSGAALESKKGAVTIAPEEKQLVVYGGAAAPGEKLALVAAPDTHALTGEQLASKYMHIAYEPLNTPDEGNHNVNAVYIPGGPMETVYSVDVTWGSMDFTYSPGHAGVWNPDTHRLDGVVPAGWSCEEGANKVRVVNHSNTAVDVGFAYTKAAGFDGVAGAFDHAGEKLPSAMGTAVDTAPEILAVLTMSGALPDSTTEKIQIGTVTVSIDAAAGK